MATMWRYAANFLVLCLAVWAGGAPADARTRRNPETVANGVARAVVDGDTLVLENGTEVRLVGIQAPKLPLGRRHIKKWPLADESKAALEALVLGRRLDLRYGTTRIDRHGRLLAHLHGPKGVWIQREMLSRGMARVYTFRDNRARAADLLAAEAAARRSRRGIWRHRFYRILTDAEASRFIDTFQLIEGRVLDVAVVRGRAFLNFGRNWRTDFTVTVAPRDLKLFRRASLPPAGYEGKRIRVRGWLKSFNGPSIVATHPEQIEVLAE